jgi:hypothetical protein
MAMPVIIALAVGIFDNSYLGGAWGYLWMRYSNAPEQAHTRQIVDAINRKRQASSETVEFAEIYPPASQSSYAWNVPDLLPLRLNLSHLGFVPSWEAAGSNDGTWIPIFSWAFVKEFLPVIAFGLPFGCWWWSRTRNLVLTSILVMAASSLIPPIFLDWGYRSTDFLRFFSTAFTFSAIPFGCLVGELIGKPSRPFRVAGALLAAAALANAMGLGALGLMPATFEVATKIMAGGTSLSQLAHEPAVSPTTPAPDSLIGEAAAFVQLARQLDDFLTPLTHGRDRAIVIVSPDKLPPLTVFPEWMQLATRSHLVLPLGWHWTDSVYAAAYRHAVLNLDPESVASLGARWVVLTNLWDWTPPQTVFRALMDSRRFVPVTTFRTGPYYLALYRACD